MTEEPIAAVIASFSMRLSIVFVCVTAIILYNSLLNTLNNCFDLVPWQWIHTLKMGILDEYCEFT